MTTKELQPFLYQVWGDWYERDVTFPDTVGYQKILAPVETGRHEEGAFPFAGEPLILNHGEQVVFAVRTPNELYVDVYKLHINISREPWQVIKAIRDLRKTGACEGFKFEIDPDVYLFEKSKFHTRKNE